MVIPPKSLTYVLGHPEAWRFLALVARGDVDRYEQVRKVLGLHPQAFLRLVDQLSGFDLVRVRGDRAAKRPHGGPIPVHVELSPRGKAMLEVLQAMEHAMEKRREQLGVRTADLLTVPT